MRRSIPLLNLLSIVFLLPGPAHAQPSARPKMLVIDYAMSYPEVNAGLMSIFTEAGFEVQYRQYYPALVEQDATTYDAIVLMGGGEPGLSVQEVDLAASFVWRGKLLILAIPSDTEFSGDRRTNAGAHDRYMFNRLLNRLRVNVQAFAPSMEESRIFTPALVCDPTPGHPVSQGIDGPIHLRAGTRLFVGDGVEPLLMETVVLDELAEAADSAVRNQPEPKVRLKKRRLQVQPAEAIPDEAIELLLRGEVALQGFLYLEKDRLFKPLTWRTAELKGQMVGVQGDTLTVRVPGTRWGADHAVLSVPIPTIARTFVTRRLPENIALPSGPEASTQVEDAPTRHAVMAVGRSDRLKKGYLVVADRDVLNTLSLSRGPLPLALRDSTDHRRTVRFLRNVGQYLVRLSANPDGWNPINPYPKARIPGVQEPRFRVNQMAILQTLPARVTVTTNRTLPTDLEDSAIPSPVLPAGDGPMQGVWDYISRADERTDSLFTLLKTLNIDFLWTVGHGWGFTTSDSAIAPSQQAQLFKVWGRRIAGHLAGSNIRWFAGVSYPELSDELERYDLTIDARGYRVGLPSPLDLRFWEERILTPTRVIATFSRTTPTLAGIINDLDTHVGRSGVSYANMDGFNDALFEHYVTHVAQYGFYRGDDFKAFRKLDRDQRFEWLMKTGRLEDYFRFLEDRAERLGRLYRSTLDAINPTLLHGGYVRSLPFTWFYLGFWRGISSPTRPYLLLTYETIPAWLLKTLHQRGVTVRPIPVVLMGLVPQASYPSVLQEATGRGGYCLERGLWLVSDPEDPEDLNAPQRQGVTREQVIEAVRQVNGMREL